MKIFENSMTNKNVSRHTALIFIAGVFLGACGSWACRTGSSASPDDRADEGLLSSLPSIIQDAHAALDEGDYEFFPNRRSIWIVNRSNGRMATYLFRDDELRSVDRSRVVTIDLKSFPRKDTQIHLSDRNQNSILWVCNTRTGDVQMWILDRDGNPKGETPVASSTDLMERPPSKTGAR